MIEFAIAMKFDFASVKTFQQLSVHWRTFIRAFNGSYRVRNRIIVLFCKFHYICDLM